MTVKSEGIVGEDNLGKLLPHRHPVDKENRGERTKSLSIRTDNDPRQKDGAPHNHLVIMRDMRAPDDTSREIHCGQRGNRIRAIDVIQWMLFVASVQSSWSNSLGPWLAE